MLRTVLVLLCAMFNGSRADWVNELRLTLANYALSKATNPPNGFVCSVIGKKHDSCHCWNEKGKPASGQTDEDCHMPPQCLAYEEPKSTGAFKWTELDSIDKLQDTLSSWGVPTDMFSTFHAAALVESANFAAFQLTVKTGDKGIVDAHVGTARKYNNTYQLGWVHGNAVADLVQPYVRDKHEVPPGDCHGTKRGMKKRGYTNDELAMINDGLIAYAFKEAAKEAQPSVMTEREFLARWEGVVSLVDLSSEDILTMEAGNPFDLLIQAIQSITGAWQSIVNAFKSSYSEQLVESHFNNGWSKYKQATKVFKGAGLKYENMDEFFQNIQSMVGIPGEYSDDFNQQIDWIKFFDNTTWSEHNTQFSQGKGGDDQTFTMYARNRQDDGVVDVLFLTCSQQFELADDYFVISESKSILGGLFSSTHLKFKKKPAAISDADLMFVSQYFTLLAYQQIALAEGTAVPPDPSFPQGGVRLPISRHLRA